MLIVGCNAYHGDVAAVSLRDGALVAALEEERFTRVKHAAGLPVHAMREAIAMAGATPADVDVFAVARARSAHPWRKLRFALRHRPGRALIGQRRRTEQRAADLPQALGTALGLDPALVASRLRYVEHHPAHLASAFYVSGFREATCCAIDGFGDFVSTSVAEGRGSSLDVRARVYFPHSLGLLYLALTQYLGFGHYGDEYKVMGLAPYGRPLHVPAISQLLHLRPGGDFELALPFFRHWKGEVTMEWTEAAPKVPALYSPRLVELLGPPRAADAAITQQHCDIAASLQQVFEEGYFHVLNAAHKRVSQPALCLAGGCAMNSVANGRIRERTPFREVFIQPAAGDNGTALGAALLTWHERAPQSPPTQMSHGYWGTAYSDTEIADAMDAADAGALCHAQTQPDAARRCRRVAEHLQAGCVVGWFQGRMEWGARALGGRSILADARRADMRDILNAKIKLRERFRPFAPSVLEEAAGEFFVDGGADPFMMQVRAVREDKRALIPAVTHVDGSARVQTVRRADNPLYWQLLDSFRALTGIPLLLNTSFNENEPIVQHPREAIDCFLRTEMDVLVLGSHVLEKHAVARVAA